MRGNALRMEELGADVEKLDRAADRKAEEALAARKRQAELLAELAAVQEREKGEAAALAALRAERAVLMEQEAAAGEEIADWAREECDYEVEARNAVEAAKERKKAAFREGRHAREALRKARLTETQLETRTVEFRLELTKRRAQYEKMVSDRIMAEAAEAAAKEAAEDEKRKAEERRKRYEEAARAEYEAEVAERQAKRNALALAERAAAPFFKQQKVILKDSGTLATVLNIRKTFGRKGTPDYLPGMRLAIGSDLRVWRPFTDVEPWVYAPTHPLPWRRSH